MNLRPALALSVLAAAVSGCTSSTSQHVIANPGDPAGAERLVNGRYIATTRPEPFAPASRTNVGSLPMNMIQAGHFAIVSDMGYRASLSSIDIATGQRVGEVKFNRTAANKTRGLYEGLAVSPDGTIYAAGGAAGVIYMATLNDDGSLKSAGNIKAKEGDFPAGLALDTRGILFATSNDPVGADAPLNSPGAVIAFDTATKREVGRFNFESYAGMSNFPLAVAVTRDGNKVFVASQRDSCVYVLDGSDPAHMRQVGKIDTGSHPSSMVFSHNEHQLFVANAHSDTVSFVDVAELKVTDTVLLRPEIAGSLSGVTPLGMSLAPNGKLLYVAIADMNAVAQVDVAEVELEGYIPAGWYPTATVTDGKRLLVANAKGSTPRYPNPPAPATQVTRMQSPNNLVEGEVFARDLPVRAERQALTQRALELARMTPRHLSRGNPLEHLGIEHVVYIVKENRTYDQILSDVPGGNADKSRLMFGRDVTPNLHALAERFVLLDNFYDCGEVSGDGWVWSTQAMANEYVIKNVPYHYSNRGREFDFEGTINGYPAGGFPAKGPDGEPLSESPQFKDGGKPIVDVAEAPGGHLWDLCKKYGVPYRNYGFYTGDSAKSGDTRITPDNYPSAAGLQPPGHDLAGISDYDFRKFDLDYADSEAPSRYAAETGDKAYLRPRETYGKHAAPSRFTEWNTEFQQMLAKDPSGKSVPSLMFVRFGNDHTQGLNGGKHTPRSQVADNDFACGQLVEAISRSPIWKDTAIFIIEDDAQNGPDHVDAHRSTCYVVSPRIRRGTIDHSFHNTVSCVRTMELLLGLPPMNGYDASSDPMRFWDSGPSNAEPFTAIWPDKKLIAEKNPDKNDSPRVSPELKTMIERSESWNFAQADKAPADELNAILWASIKGTATPMPDTPHGPKIPGMAQRKDDDD